MSIIILIYNNNKKDDFIFLFFGNKLTMKKQLDTIESVKKRLENIRGTDVLVAVNRGRKKIVKYDAKLLNLYPSVFTVSVENSNQPERSYSYTEVLCGNVRISPKTN